MRQPDMIIIDDYQTSKPVSADTMKKVCEWFDIYIANCASIRYGGKTIEYKDGSLMELLTKGVK